MSMFFADEDNITFGVQASNVVEVAQFSSTLDDVFVRFYTNNGIVTPDNLETGIAIGASNYDKTVAKKNNLYFAHIDDTSNLTRIFTMEETRIGINTDSPTASLHVVGADSNILQFMTSNNTPGITMNAGGFVGINTNAVNGQNVTISGSLYVDEVKLSGLVASSLSNVAYLDVAALTNTTTHGSINVSQSTLSNIYSVDTANLLTTTSSQIINVNSNTLSNVKTVSLDNLTSDGSNINVSTKTLSNITTASVVNLTSDGSNINVSTRSLSNITTIFTESINAHGDNINVSMRSLSNITTASLMNLTSDGSNINVSTRSLSNITTASIVNLTSDGSNINVSTRTLSNITTTFTEQLSSHGDNINVSSKTLSNITTTFTEKLSSHSDNINVSSKTLSNITTTFTEKLNSHSDNINVSARSLSNIQTTFTENINAHGDNINVSGRTLSNIAVVSLSKLTSDTATINVSTKTLSNITTTFTESISAHGCNINVSTRSLSNITTTYTQTANVSKITTTHVIGLIDMDQTSLSNLDGVYLNGGATLYTNSISTSANCNISFNNNDISGVRNLTVAGDITVRGEFFVMDTTTCNTNQLMIENDGTGPALVVNQLGVQDIMQVQDDSNVVFFIKNGGQAAFGNFGTVFTSNAHPHALVYIENPLHSNQTALHIKQLESDHNILTMEGASKTIVVNAYGNIGIGTNSASVPLAIHDTSAILIPVGTSGERPGDIQGYIRYNTTLSAFEGCGASNTWGTLGGVKDVDGNTYIAAEVSAGSDDNTLRFVTDGMERMRITATGEVGVGTTAVLSKMHVEGDTLIRNGRLVNQVTTGALYSELKTGTDNVVQLGFSNTTARLHVGVQSNATYVMNETANDLYFGTNNTGQMYIKSDGYVGIGTATPATKLEVTGTVRAPTIQISTISSLDTVIDVTDRTLSNINYVKADNIEVSNMDLANLTINNITSFNSNINVTTRSLSNISTTFTESISAHGSNINVSTRSLSNITTVSIMNLTSDDSNINVSFKTLSNIETIFTEKLNSQGDNINVSTRSLSNITTTFTEKLSSHSDNINVSGKSLSNLSSVSTIAITSDADNINISAKSLSNITSVSIINLTSDGSNINVSARSLSNIMTASIAKLTSDTDTINVSFKTLSNIETTYTEKLNSQGDNINVSTRSLSNITTTFTEKLSSHSDNINVSGKSLSNLSSVSTVAITSDADNINISAKSLSNITSASIMNLTSDGSNINVSARSLSNINTVFTEKLNSHSDNINVSTKSLSNITTTFTESLSAHGLNINVSGKTLSNITTTFTESISSQSDNINLSTRSLSNITTVSIAKLTSDSATINVSFKTLSNIETTFTEKLSAQGDNINVSTKTLSNITTVSATNVTLSKLTTTNAANMIDVDGKTLSNVKDVFMNALSTLHVNTIDTFTGSNINFSNNDVSGIHNLTVSGDIKVRGEFFVMETTTCNTNQMRIENDGTGPALVVNQMGTEHITQFQDDGDVVFFIKDGGQAAFGNFGVNINSNIPAALVYMENPSDQTQVGLWVQQQNTSSDIVRLRGDGCNLTVTHDGKLGIGIDAPTARIHAVQGDSTTTEFMHFSTSADANALVVSASGRLGVGTNASTDYSVFAKGVLRAENLIVSPYEGVGSVPLVTAYGMTATDSRDYLLFNQMDFSNVDVIYANQVRATNDGTASAPAYTFADNTTTGIFQPAQQEIALTTNSVERMRVLSDGNVGIGTTSPATKLEVSGTIRAPTVELNTLSTANVSGIIDVNSKTLSNVTTVSVINLTSDGCNINISTRSLSNITTVFAENLNAHGSNINVSTKSLSNVTTISVASITSDELNINVSGKTLSNIAVLSASTATITKLTTAQSSSFIDVDSKSLSNMGSVYVKADSTVYTNSIDTFTGDLVSFNGNSVTGISNLTVSGDITVRGEFFVMETTTCNTNQIQIENDGTGPALIVNQLGTEHITQFQDDGDVVFFIKDGGQAAFGSFGSNINSNIPATQVFIENQSSKDQDALTIKQDRSNKNIVKMIGTAASDVVVSAAGKIGMNVASPSARIDIAQSDSNVTLFQYASPTVPNAFVIDGSGRVGLGVAPSASYALTTQGVIDTTSLRVTNINSAAQNINFNMRTLSNISWIQSEFFSVGGIQSGQLEADTLTIGTITTSNAGDAIDLNAKSLSNVQNVNTEVLETSVITSTDPSINVSGKTFSNVNALNAVSATFSTSVSTPVITSPTNEISFNWRNILEVDSLVVRSNISVLLTGTGTYSNLPTDLVRVTAQTGRIADEYISSNVVRLIPETGLINENLLPPVESNRKTLMHTKDRVGIGLRNPQQKLHVHGTACITSGRLGIGSTSPIGVLHVVDTNGASPTVHFEQKGSSDILRIIGSNQMPLLYINGNNSVGIHTAAPSSIFALDVNGIVNASGARVNNLDSATGTVNCGVNSLSNIFNMTAINAHISGVLSTSGNFTASNMTTSNMSINTLNTNTATTIQSYAPMYISGYSTGLYAVPEVVFGNSLNVTRIGLRVNDNVLAGAYLSLSDRRVKKEIVESVPEDDLQKIMNTSVYTFKMVDQESRMAGFIAQEVEQTIPSAVRTTVGAIPNVLTAAESVSEEGSLIHLTNHPMHVGDYVKFLVDTTEFTSMVTETTSATFRIKTPIQQGAQNVYIYGTYVSDLKMVDTDQLLPIVFNAVKELHKSVSTNHSLIQSVLTRLSALESAKL